MSESVVKKTGPLLSYLHFNKLAFLGLVPRGSVLGYPKYFLSLKRPRSQLFLRWQIRRAYSRLIRAALRNGVTKNDLRSILESGSYFDLPDLEALCLRGIRRNMKRLRFASQALKELGENPESIFRKVLKRQITGTTFRWNPAFPTKQDEIASGLAPRNQPVNSYEMLMYVIPSPLGVNWAKPDGVLRAIKNYIVPGKHHYIGHVIVELRQDNETIALAAMTGDTNIRVIRELFTEGIGLGFLFHTFPGRLECYSHLKDDLEKHIKHRRVSYLRFNIDEERLKLAKQFLDNWMENGLYQKYGLWQEPLVGEGAGCSSFGVGFLELMGFDPAELVGTCKRTVNIPTPLLGGPGRGRFVSITRLVWLLLCQKKYTRWACDHEPHEKLAFWDPDAIFDWIQQKFTDPKSNCLKESIQRASGIVLEDPKNPV